MKHFPRLIKVGSIWPVKTGLRFLFAVSLELCVVALLVFVNQAQNKCRFICTSIALLFVFGFICAC